MASAEYHLVTDFDGVWTDPTREFHAIMETLGRELARLSGRPEAEVLSLLQKVQDRVFKQPEKFGWRIHDHLTSYVDEDYFAIPAALGQFMEQSQEAPFAELGQAVLGENPSMTAFMDEVYHGTCRRFRKTVDHDLAHGAEHVLRWLLRHQVRVTFVTNAPPEKIIDWFAHHDLPVLDARQEDADEVGLRVYGRAGKQWLGDPDLGLELNGRFVRTDRPQYREILERECPDMVIGDVLSLDLAQPLGMRVAGHPAAPQDVAIIRKPYTPAWVLQSLGPEAHNVDFQVHHVTSLPRILTESYRRLQASRDSHPAPPQQAAGGPL
ncbi:MAG: hypothetical protein DWQ01_22670 [Planctomycetota bacterium]|nr:MAG: hypothetical protein DWQ01_22670 [Planctomycetota bacterium]